MNKRLLVICGICLVFNCKGDKVISSANDCMPIPKQSDIVRIDYTDLNPAFVKFIESIKENTSKLGDFEGINERRKHDRP